MTTLTIVLSDDETTLTITCEPPLDYKGGSIAEMVLHEPLARQVREAEKELTGDNLASMTTYETRLITNCAGLPAVAGDVLPITLINHAAGFLQAFVEKGGSPEPDLDDDQPWEAPEPERIELDPPIAFAGETYYALDIREPLGLELRKARMLLKTGSFFESRRAQMHLLTLVCGIPAPVVDALPITVLNRASRALSRFIVAGRRIGKR